MGQRAPVNRKNQPIKFVKTTLQKDEFGDRIPVETTIFSCWAEYYTQSLSAKSSTIGTVYEDSVFFKVDAHHRKRIDPSHKILFDGGRYEIVKVDYQPQKREVLITAKVVM